MNGINFYQFGILNFLKSHNNAFEVNDGLIIGITDDDEIKFAKTLPLSGGRT